MRVVHVVRSDAFAGVERYVVDTARELARRDWDVTVIGGDPARMRAALGELAHVPAGTVREVAAALVRAGRADVLHAHMTAAEVPAALLKRRAALVVTRHFAARRGHSRLGRVARPLVLRRVDLQIAISDFVAERVDGASVVIHNGVPVNEAADAEREPTVVTLQRLATEKDTATAVRAWAASGLAERGWRFEVLGRGSEADALRALADELGATVEFRGFVADARAELPRHAIMLAPAPAEHLGLAVLEGMAAGCAVVAADGGAHRETLGEAGRYFPPGDVAACARELVALADAVELRTELGAQLRARQRAEFTIERHVDRLEAAYREVSAR